MQIGEVVVSPTSFVEGLTEVSGEAHILWDDLLTEDEVRNVCEVEAEIWDANCHIETSAQGGVYVAFVRRVNSLHEYRTSKAKILAAFKQLGAQHTALP